MYYSTRANSWARRHPRIVLAVGSLMILGFAAYSFAQVAAIWNRPTTSHLEIAISGGLGCLAVGVVTASLKSGKARLGLWITCLAVGAWFIAFVFSGAYTRYGNPSADGVAWASPYMGTVELFLGAMLIWRAKTMVTLGKKGMLDLLTAIVSNEANGWMVTWAGDDRLPRDLGAPTLTKAVEDSTASFKALGNRHQNATEAELQFAVYPWKTKGKIMAIFRVSQSAGSFEATDLQGSGRHVSGASLEDLVSAIDPGGDSGNVMLTWVATTEIRR